MSSIRLLYIDLFCGAGGTSSGVEYARFKGKKCAKVIACVNHDKNAILSHAANHPDVMHFTEDIRTLELSPLTAHLKKMKAKYPNAYVVLWASLECTNFSKAKGGQPRDADSRTLAEHLFRYIETLDPDYIQIENVEEFMSWGDLDENGKPVSMKKGASYMRWVNNVKAYGYDYSWRILNAADFGAYTSRKRFFGQFAKRVLPIAFPTPTHSKNGGSDMFGSFEKWKPVREVLDLNNEGESIFDRKKPLVEKTLERIYAGLLKFVAGGKDAFLVKYNSLNQQGKYQAPSIDDPCPTVATQNRLGIARVQFLSKQFSGEPFSKNIGIDGPAAAVTTKDHHAFITAYYGGADHNYDINEPGATVTTKDRMAIVNPEFLTAFYGNGSNHSIEEPAPTVTTKDRFGIVTSHFLANEYSGGGQISDIEKPNPAVLTTPKQKLVSADRFLMNPQYQSVGGDIDKPCFTLIARMDKMPPYLISTKKGLGIKIYDADSPATIRIKEFMALYNIVDVKMRMLSVDELKRIMGFPDSYVLVGTQAEQKKYIGNAVEVNMSRVLCQALCQALSEKFDN